MNHFKKTVLTLTLLMPMPVMHSMEQPSRKRTSEGEVKQQSRKQEIIDTLTDFQTKFSKEQEKQTIENALGLLKADYSKDMLLFVRDDLNTLKESTLNYDEPMPAQPFIESLQELINKEIASMNPQPTDQKQTTSHKDAIFSWLQFFQKHLKVDSDRKRFMHHYNYLNARYTKENLTQLLTQAELFKQCTIMLEENIQMSAESFIKELKEVINRELVQFPEKEKPEQENKRQRQEHQENQGHAAPQYEQPQPTHNQSQSYAERMEKMDREHEEALKKLKEESMQRAEEIKRENERLKEELAKKQADAEKQREKYSQWRRIREEKEREYKEKEERRRREQEENQRQQEEARRRKQEEQDRAEKAAKMQQEQQQRREEENDMRRQADKVQQQQIQSWQANRIKAFIDLGLDSRQALSEKDVTDAYRRLMLKSLSQN